MGKTEKEDFFFIFYLNIIFQSEIRFELDDWIDIFVTRLNYCNLQEKLIFSHLV